MAVTLEELQIKFSAQMGNLTSQLNGVKKQLGGVTASAGKASTAMSGLAKMAKLFVGVYVVRGMVRIGKESLKMANDVVESEQLFGVSMKGMADSAREWSDELSASLGLNAYGLRKNVGIFNTMFTSMGLSTDKAYEMSTGLVELAEDMASFYNMDSEEAFTKLRAGITGETEPLKRLGIMVDEATTKQYALSEGISQTGKELTQTEKLMARYAAIMGQTADAQGDLARTIDSPVNQIRILGNTLDMAKIALGQAFQPIQAIVLPLLNSLAQAALGAANALKTFMWALTGFTGIGANAGAIAGAGADANEDLTDSLNDSAKAYKAAGGAAKKASKDAKVGLKAFDEINKLTEESADKGSGGGGGISEKPEIVAAEEQSAAMEALGVAVSKAAEWLKKLWDLALPTREAMSRLWDSLSRFGNVVWDGLVDFYNKFLVPIGKWAVTKALPVFLDMLSAAINMLSVAIETVRPSWDRFYNNVLVPIGNWAGDKIIQALNFLRDGFDKISNWIKENPETFQKIEDGLQAFAAGIMAVYVASTILKTVNTIFKSISGVITFMASPLGAIGLLAAALYLIIDNWDAIKAHALSCWDEIKTEWGIATEWFSINIIEPIKRYFNDLWGAILYLGRIAWESIVDIWNAAAGWFDTYVLQPINKFFMDVFGAVYLAVKQTWENIKAAWEGAKQWFNDLLQPVKDAIADIKKSWETVKGFFGGKITQEVEIKYTSSGNPYAGRSGSLAPQELPPLSLPKLSLNKLSLQKFAAGGVFAPNKPFLGILGEQKNGRNIEAPESVLRDIFRDEMGKTSIMPRSIGMSADLPAQNASVVQQAVEAVLDRLQITLNVDGETWGRASVKHINNAQRMSGKLLLEM